MQVGLRFLSRNAIKPLNQFSIQCKIFVLLAEHFSRRHSEDRAVVVLECESQARARHDIRTGNGLPNSSMQTRVHRESESAAVVPRYDG